MMTGVQCPAYSPNMSRSHPENKREKTVDKSVRQLGGRDTGEGRMMIDSVV